MAKTNLNRRNGSVLILFLLLLPIVILLVGFTIDFAHVQRVRAELRRSTDLAAKASAAALSQNVDTAHATQVAKDVAELNLVHGQPLSLANDQIIFGSAVRNGDGTASFVAGGMPTNAVRIIGKRTADSIDGPVPTWFGVLYNHPTFDQELVATAAFIDSDICLVLDRSSSMKLATSDPAPLMGGSDPRLCDIPYADSRWVAMADAVDIFLATIDRSQVQEQVAVVTFASDSSECSTFVPVTSVDQALTTDTSLITDALDQRSSEIWTGQTDIAAGIQQGQTVLLNGRPTAFKYMILLTDGEYTEADPLPLAQIAASNDITIHTITFGVGANQSDMQAIAAAAGGQHFHATTAAELQSVFRELAANVTQLID